MKLKKSRLIVKRSYKEVYKTDEGIVKIFEPIHPKAAIFNEALNTVRVEETDLNIPRLKEVKQIDGKWAIIIEYKPGKTLEQMMRDEPENLEKYMSDFVELQLKMQKKKAPMLNSLKDKLAREISSLTALDAAQRQELLARLEGMPRRAKLCHGDFNPSNIIVENNGRMTVIDWAHATQGNASADAAMTYLLFALEDQRTADIYLNLFCRKSDTAKQYVRQWLPIVAAAQLEKENELGKEFLMQWIDVTEE